MRIDDNTFIAPCTNWCGCMTELKIIDEHRLKIADNWFVRKALDGRIYTLECPSCVIKEHQN